MKKKQTGRTKRSAAPAPPTDHSGLDQGDVVTHPHIVDPEVISTFRETQYQRSAAIAMRIRINLQTGAIVRRALGWSMEIPEKDRKAIAVNAAALVAGMQKKIPLPIDEKFAEIADVLHRYSALDQKGSAPFLERQADCEEQMIALSRALPVWPWVESVRGFGPIGLAIIVGEAGDLLNYPNPAKLWKRLGLAVFDCKSQRRCTDPEEAMRQGYSPRRRSACWTIADSLIKASGQYQDLYRARKLYEVAIHPEFDNGINKVTGRPKVTKHCDLRARRYVEKRLILNLWKAWRAAAAGTLDEFIRTNTAGTVGVPDAIAA